MYDPRFPSLTRIVNKHFRTMIQDPHLKEVFSGGFIIAYKRPKNIRQLLIRSKVPPAQTRPRRSLPGMRRCKGCVTCPFVRPGKTIKATATNYRTDINLSVDCNTNNVIYCIECIKPGCRQQYIGQTSDSLKNRFNQHRGYVRNEVLTKATGSHFNGTGHQISDMQVTIVEKVFNKCEFFRRRRESYFIRKFNSKHKGINRISWCFAFKKFFWFNLFKTLNFNLPRARLYKGEFSLSSCQSPDAVWLNQTKLILLQVLNKR